MPIAPSLETVVLVDAQDRELGEMEKQRAHAQGRLHRAVSVFVLNSRGEMLLQRRAAAKYHSGGLWSNACCSHPRPGEDPVTAARRRLREEMGLDCALEPGFTFVYRAEVGVGLIEHELDHVFLARCDDAPRPDAGEVAAWRWVSPGSLARELSDGPRAFTPWFRLALAHPAWPEPGFAVAPEA